MTQNNDTRPNFEELLQRAGEAAKQLTETDGRRRDSLEQLVSTVTRLTNENIQLSDQLEENKLVLATERSRSDGLEQQVGERQRHIGELEAALQEAKAALQAERDGATSMKEALEQAREELEQAQHDNAELARVFDMFVQSVGSRSQQLQEEDRTIEAALVIAKTRARFEDADGTDLSTTGADNGEFEQHFARAFSGSTEAQASDDDFDSDQAPEASADDDSSFNERDDTEVELEESGSGAIQRVAQGFSTLLRPAS